VEEGLEEHQSSCLCTLDLAAPQPDLVVLTAWVPPYKQSCASKWSPEERIDNNVVEIAAIPLAVINAASAFSRAANFSWSTV
jgi:hypothetical protein